MATTTPEGRVNEAAPGSMARSSREQALVQIAARDAPLARGLPLIGSLFEARRDPLTFFAKITREHGDYVAVRFGPLRYLFVNDPDGVRHILVDNHRNYPKSRSYEGLKLVLGEGLVTSEGDFWRRQRRLAQPAFHKDRLASFARLMAADTASMLERWRGIEAGVPFDLHYEMMRLTLRIVNRTLFSTDTDADAADVGRAMTIAIEYVNDYADAPIRIPPWLPTPKNFRFRKALRTLDALVLRIIDERRRSGQESPDLLSMLMSAKDEETREQMTDRQLRDEVMTIVSAGHETTANALTFTFYLLSQQPAVARLLRREVTEVLGGRTPAIEDLPRLTYTRMVLEESMRLYPPAWAIERTAVADDEVGGVRVPRRTILAMSPYMLHRHPRYWENPEGFDPERFAPDRTAARPKFAYLPFGGGPRLCIGNSFALMEAQIILAMVMADCALDLCTGFPVELEPSVTLRPRKGIWVQRRRVPAAQIARTAG
jgi:cytochrome P450